MLLRDLGNQFTINEASTRFRPNSVKTDSPQAQLRQGSIQAFNSIPSNKSVAELRESTLTRSRLQKPALTISTAQSQLN